MCGIAGFAGPGDRDDLSAMMEMLVHRGPDGDGAFHDPELRLFLGHRRLAVVDIAGGAQPMWNAEGTLCVTFNGEIYNHRELRADLERLGRRFRTDHSDTEVLLHGYAQWGEDLPRRLNGMFAFCIFDAKRRGLFLARDRFGEKPLYYTRQGELFAFASELSALTRHRRFSARLHRRSLQKLLAYGFLPAPNAVLEDCHKLPGGCSLTFDLVSGELAIRRYWKFEIETELAWRERSEADLADELRSLLFEAVKRRMAADVPLGFFLSGGVDSAAVLAAATQHRPAHSLKAYTLGFHEPSYDETEPASLAARALNVRHAVEHLDFDRARDLAPGVLSRLDEPSCDASILPTHLLSRFARREVTVALTGDGSDELFAGYDPFAALAPARLYRSFVPRPLHQLLREAVHRLPRSPRNMGLDFKLKRTLTGLNHRPALWNPVWLSPVDPLFMADLFEDALTPEELYSEALGVWEANDQLSLVDRSLEFYTTFYLQDGILNKVDRASMLCSLEARAPFLDNDLVDFCRRLPHRFKLHRGQRKYLLKKAMKGLLPDEILSRPKKGFGIPTAAWLMSMPSQPPLEPIPRMRMDRVAQSWRDHRSGAADNRLFLWSWLSVQSLSYLTSAIAGPSPPLAASPGAP